MPFTSGLPGMLKPRLLIAPTVDWIVNNSGMDRTRVGNYIRAHKNDRLVQQALSGNSMMQCALMKQIGMYFGLRVFDDAYSCEDIMNAARINRGRPMDESAGVTRKPLVEMVVYKKGHKNSKGEDAPWTIVSCKTGKILSSHKSKKKAEEHLKQMEYYKHTKTESLAGALREGYQAIVEASTEATGGLRVEPGWPEQYDKVDYTSMFSKCPYAKKFIDLLQAKLKNLGTLYFDGPSLVDDRGPVESIRLGGLDVSMNRYNNSKPHPFLNLYSAVNGSRKSLPVIKKNIGSIHHPGNYFELTSQLIWNPGYAFDGEDAPANKRFQITPENIPEAVQQIVSRVKWCMDNHLDLDACRMMLRLHRNWINRRAKNVSDTPVGKKFVERFNMLSEKTPLITMKNFWDEDIEKHVVGIEKGRDLNRVGINKLDIYTVHGGEIGMRDLYTLRCTSDGSVILFGHGESLDYGSVLLTEDNWADVCDDVFNEACDIEKQGAEANEKKKAKEREREAGRVMCDRARIKAKFGDFIYKKFFDVIDQGELNGKSTDEIITDLRCAIAEDQAEYEVMKKQDRIRAGKE